MQTISAGFDGKCSWAFGVQLPGRVHMRKIEGSDFSSFRMLGPNIQDRLGKVSLEI